MKDKIKFKVCEGCGHKKDINDMYFFEDNFYCEICLVDVLVNAGVIYINYSDTEHKGRIVTY